MTHFVYHLIPEVNKQVFPKSFDDFREIKWTDFSESGTAGCSTLLIMYNLYKLVIKGDSLKKKTRGGQAGSEIMEDHECQNYLTKHIIK